MNGDFWTGTIIDLALAFIPSTFARAIRGMQYAKADKYGGRQLIHFMDESWLPPGLAAKIIGGSYFAAGLGSLISYTFNDLALKDCY